MAKFTSLNINGKPVKTLYIDGKQVAIGSEEQLGYLCFTAEEPYASVSLTRYNQPPEATFQTSTDGKIWNDYQPNDVIYLNKLGDKVYFKAKSTNTTLASYDGDHEFMMMGKIAASGNVNTLLTEDLAEAKTMSLEGRNNCFSFLFNYCESLTQAPALPATTLAQQCYDNMFAHCTSLTKAPELPATTLATGCYYWMFAHCTSLTKAPELPATTLAGDCYYNMFADCYSLNYIKVAFLNWDPVGATDNWLPENAGTFKCPWTLITNTSTRTASTVPSTWTMVAV